MIKEIITKNNLSNPQSYIIETMECPAPDHKDILIEPVLCKGCEQVFCKACTDDLKPCTACKKTEGYTTIGTKIYNNAIATLQFKCNKCPDAHQYSKVMDCDKIKCEMCETVQDEKSHHQECQRCYSSFATSKDLNFHIKNKKCMSEQSYLSNHKVNNSVKDIWNALERLNQKVNFVFDTIWNILSDKGLTDTQQNIKEFSTGKIQQVHKEIYNKTKFGEDLLIDVNYTKNIDYQRTQTFSQLDLKVVQSNNLMELIDCYNNTYLGKFEIKQNPDISLEQFQNVTIGQTIYSKDMDGNLHILNLMCPNYPIIKVFKNQKEVENFVKTINSRNSEKDRKILTNFIKIN